MIVVQLAPSGQQGKRRRAKGLLTAAWLLGAAIGFLPLAGWHKPKPTLPRFTQGSGQGSEGRREGRGVARCVFTEVMDERYLLSLFALTIVFPTLLMAAFYTRIYLRVHEHQRSTLSLRFAYLPLPPPLDV